MRQNAALWYGFLAPLLLLAKHKPEFQSAFVREHFWNATRIHLIYGLILCIKLFLFWFHIPVLSGFVFDLILIIIAFWLLIPLGFWLYNALQGESVSKDIWSDFLWRAFQSVSSWSQTTQKDENLDDIEILAGAFSVIPFLGHLLPIIHPSQFSKEAWKVSGAIFLLILLISWMDTYGVLFSSFVTLLAIGIILYAIISVVKKQPLWRKYLSQIPSYQSVYEYVISSLQFFANLVISLISKKVTLQPWSEHLLRVKSAEESRLKAQQELATDEPLPGHWILSILPWVSILYAIWVQRYKHHYARSHIHMSIIWTMLSVLWIVFIGWGAVIWVSLYLWLSLAVSVATQDLSIRIPILSEIYEVAWTVKWLISLK